MHESGYAGDSDDGGVKGRIGDENVGDSDEGGVKGRIGDEGCVNTGPKGELV